MLIQKLQLLKIPDALETALEYEGVERWVCWYWDDDETLLIEDINSSYFGNQKAWLLFCSYINANKKVDKGSTYDYFESLVSGQCPYHDAHEAETKVTKTLSSTNDKKAYLFDRQTRELYSGCLLDIQALIKQPKTLVMWAELQARSYDCINSDAEFSLLNLIDEDLALNKSKPRKNLPSLTLLKVTAVRFGLGIILSIPLTLAINTLHPMFRVFLPHPSNSSEKLQVNLAELALENQTAELLQQEQPLKVSKKPKLECKSKDIDK